MFQLWVAPFRKAVQLHCKMWHNLKDCCDSIVQNFQCIGNVVCPKHGAVWRRVVRVRQLFWRYFLLLKRVHVLISFSLSLAENQLNLGGHNGAFTWPKKSDRIRSKEKFILPFLPFPKSFSFSVAFSALATHVWDENRRIFRSILLISFRIPCVLPKLYIILSKRNFDSVIIKGRRRPSYQNAHLMSVLCSTLQLQRIRPFQFLFTTGTEVLAIYEKLKAILFLVRVSSGLVPSLQHHFKSWTSWTCGTVPDESRIGPFTLTGPQVSFLECDPPFESSTLQNVQICPCKTHARVFATGGAPALPLYVSSILICAQQRIWVFVYNESTIGPFALAAASCRCLYIIGCLDVSQMKVCWSHQTSLALKAWSSHEYHLFFLSLQRVYSPTFLPAVQWKFGGCTGFPCLALLAKPLSPFRPSTAWAVYLPLVL